MKKIFNTPHLILGLFLVILGVVVIPLLTLQGSASITIPKDAGVSRVGFAHPLYPANFADNATLLGASQNVFIGKVLTQGGSGDLAGSPTTQFSVDVIENIKGDLKDTVTVTQLAGYRDGVLYIMDEGNHLLESGSTYLFATRYNPVDNTYTLNTHENASKLISNDNLKSNNSLKALADMDEKVLAWEVAYPDEKLLDADIAHNNIRNSFKSLPAVKKAVAQSRADEAKASLAANVQ